MRRRREEEEASRSCALVFVSCYYYPTNTHTPHGNFRREHGGTCRARSARRDARSAGGDDVASAATGAPRVTGCLGFRSAAAQDAPRKGVTTCSVLCALCVCVGRDCSLLLSLASPAKSANKTASLSSHFSPPPSSL